MNIALVGYLAAFLYLTGGFATGLRLFGARREIAVPVWTGRLLGAAALALHTLVLQQALLSEGGLNLSFFNVVSAVAWTIVLMLLAASLIRPVENLGILLLPLAGLTVLLEIRFPAIQLLETDAATGVHLHVTISILAYSLLTLASVQALLLALQDHHLRRHRPGGFIRALPPLQTMEDLLFQLIGSGFVALSAALLSGFFFLEDMFAQHLVHKTALSMVAWVTFAVLVWGRWRHGWRGRTAINWTLVGFVLLMLAYFGSKAVLELMLGR